MANKNEISEFLLIVKSYIKNKNYDFITRDRKNLYELGISFDDAINIIEHLQLENYYQGPEEDRNKKGNLIYTFGYDDNNIQIYIKLTFRQRDDLFIMSFHKAKYIIIYPFKKSRK